MSRPSFAFQPRLRAARPRSAAHRLHRAVAALGHHPRVERCLVRAACAGARASRRLPPESARSKPPEAPLQAQIYRRSHRRRPAPRHRRARSAAPSGVQLNFEQAEIRDVIKVILGDILGRSLHGRQRRAGPGHAVDQRADVRGRPPGRARDGAARQRRHPGREPAPTPTASCRSTPRSAGPQVVPLGGRPVQVRPGLRHHDRAACATSRRPRPPSSSSRWSPRPRTSGSIPAATPSCSAAPASERQNVVETLADLDVDWMAGKSIGLFPLQRANAEAIIPELQAIFAPFDPTGAEPSLIRFVPLARLNAVLAIGGDTEQIREVEHVGVAARPRPDRGHRSSTSTTSSTPPPRTSPSCSTRRSAMGRPASRADARLAASAALGGGAAARARMARRVRRTASAQPPGAGARGKPGHSTGRSRSWRARPTTRC